MFEYTSKIPVKEIEKKARMEAKEETKTVASPYTRKVRKYSKNYYITIGLVIFILVIFAILWSIKQITIDNSVTKEISYIKHIDRRYYELTK